MTIFKHIFDVFSRRPEAAAKRHDVPQSMRNRVLLWCCDLSLANS